MKKGYKVTDVKREKKIGVAAENLKELIEKSCQKLSFNVSCAECRLFVAEDGTQVDDDDYLATLPPQTLFILLTKKQKMVTDFDFYYNLIRSSKKDYIDTGVAAKEFLNTNIRDKFKVFQKYIAAADDAKTLLSDRSEDPNWFEGLELSEKTKEQSMCKRAKERMRGYYYKTKTALKSSDFYVHSKNGQEKFIVTIVYALIVVYFNAEVYGTMINAVTTENTLSTRIVAAKKELYSKLGILIIKLNCLVQLYPAFSKLSKHYN
ncbi:DNA fragmentation factor subunit beta [Papilio xuthus]|uniref:DNAation factor subunit beta n=1 Tax=Papilio xuthus TaxID=66420 RepID=A0A194QCC5_PAPXU|nr:DNA fragmentation factor subunit beta [Papilio xuthus]